MNALSKTFLWRDHLGSKETLYGCLLTLQRCSILQKTLKNSTLLHHVTVDSHHVENQHDFRTLPFTTSCGWSWDPVLAPEPEQGPPDGIILVQSCLNLQTTQNRVKQFL